MEQPNGVDVVAPPKPEYDPSPVQPDSGNTPQPENITQTDVEAVNNGLNNLMSESNVTEPSHAESSATSTPPSSEVVTPSATNSAETMDDKIENETREAEGEQMIGLQEKAVKLVNDKKAELDSKIEVLKHPKFVGGVKEFLTVIENEDPSMAEHVDAIKNKLAA